MDKAFVRIDDPSQAQVLHRHLDHWAQRFCPVLHHFRAGYHWSFMLVEYATDVVFHRQSDLQSLYEAIDKMAGPAKVKGRSFRGFNLFLDPDYRLFLTLDRGEWAISGFRAADLRAHMPGLTPGRSSDLLKRLRTHGLIKKIGHT